MIMKTIHNPDIEIHQIVNDMKVGWNLGNSLESPAPEHINATLEEYETSWGNPVTTNEMIKKVIDAGFRTIRIPVTWWKLMNKDSYRVNEKWLNRVQEVADYAYSQGVYVIIDVHHEDEWLYLGNNEVELQAMKILERLWLQIAKKFKDYDYHLIFETMNETRLIRTEQEWGIGDKINRDIINKYNEIAVNTIRSTGGNNITRPIIIKTIGARYNAEAIKDIVIPNNEHRIILSVHAYIPYEFCMVPEASGVWGSDKEKKELFRLIDSIAIAAKEKKVPVIIGEFGTIDKKNTVFREEYTADFIMRAKQNGITCIVWDNNIASKNIEPFTYSIFNREDLTWRFPKILNAIINNS